MNSPSTPQVAQGRARELQERPINTLTEQLQGCTISKPKKREQTTATPASQARPRTQRRTGADQENALAPVESGGVSTSSNITPSRLNCYADLQDELSCGICLDICVRPCATPCGHAFCRTCLRQALQHKRQCPKCREVLPTSWQPKVNIALWNTIQLLFPRHAAQAPPATPPQPPAAARASKTGRTRGSGGSQSALMQNSSLSGGVFAAHSQAARQAFRPPRPAAASEDDLQRSRSHSRQQHQAERFVMSPGLQLMLQGMARSSQQGGAASQRRHNTRQQQSNLFANAASRPFQAQGSVSIDIDVEDDVLSQLTGSSSQPQTANRRIRTSSQSQQAAQPVHERRRAAAARVHAAIAEDEAFQQSDEEQQLHAAILASLHDRSTRYSMQLTDASVATVVGGDDYSRMRVRGNSCFRAADSSSSRKAWQQAHNNAAAAPERSSRVVSSDTDEDFFPDFDVSEISDDAAAATNSQPVGPAPADRHTPASLFGMIHSGRSPNTAHQPEDASDDEWIHEVGAIADGLVNITGTAGSTAAAAVAGSSETAAVPSPNAGGEPSSSQPVAATALTTHWQRQHSSNSSAPQGGAEASQLACQVTSDAAIEDLLDDLDDSDEEDLGPTLWQRNRVATTAARTTAAAVAGTAQSRANHASAPATTAIAVVCTEVLDEIAERPQRQAGGAMASSRPASAQGTAPEPADAVVSRRRGGRARVIQVHDAGEPGVAASSTTGTTAAITVVGGGTCTYVQQSVQGESRGATADHHTSNSAAAGPAVATTAAVYGNFDSSGLDVEELVIAPSPEPQPLLARLAHFGSQVSREHSSRSVHANEQRQQNSSSSALSQLVNEALGACVAASTPAAAAAAGGGGNSGFIEEDEEFLPPRPNRRGWNATAAVSAALERQAASRSPPRGRSRAQARVGRVVPGLRRSYRG